MKTALKHREFRLLNADSLAPGTQIFCREGDAGEMIYHHYLVSDFMLNKRITLSSEPSTILINIPGDTREYHCNSIVYVDFKALNGRESSVSFTIVIQMPGYLFKWAGAVLGEREQGWSGKIISGKSLPDSGINSKSFKIIHMYRQNFRNHENTAYHDIYFVNFFGHFGHASRFF